MALRWVLWGLQGFGFRVLGGFGKLLLRGLSFHSSGATFVTTSAYLPSYLAELPTHIYLSTV